MQGEHPEKGPSGHGWDYYENYDAFGRLGRVLDGPNDLGYVYDDLGRNTGLSCGLVFTTTTEGSSRAVFLKTASAE